MVNQTPGIQAGADEPQGRQTADNDDFECRRRCADRGMRCPLQLCSERGRGGSIHPLRVARHHIRARMAQDYFREQERQLPITPPPGARSSRSEPRSLSPSQESPIHSKRTPHLDRKPLFGTSFCLHAAIRRSWLSLVAAGSCFSSLFFPSLLRGLVPRPVWPAALRVKEPCDDGELLSVVGVPAGDVERMIVKKAGEMDAVDVGMS